MVSDPVQATLTQLNLTPSSGTPNFSKSSCSSGCDETTVGLFKTEDDLGDSYYFRGDVENNYVYFANKYWRIIRINGDGTIRMIYAGTSAHPNGYNDYNDSSTNDMGIGTNKFNVADYIDNAYVGFMYGATYNPIDYSYDKTHANTNNSTIKGVLDTWYKNNIKNTTNEQYVVDAIYCNDRELQSGTGTGDDETYYKAYNRIKTNKTPTLKCNKVNDRFTVNTTLNGVTGNGALTYPIGLITIDEALYAGTVSRSGANIKYYLYTGGGFWTMSPSHFNSSFYMFFISYAGFVNQTVGGDALVVRPVISISGTALNSGNGTKTDPFKIQ